MRTKELTSYTLREWLESIPDDLPVVVRDQNDTEHKIANIIAVHDGDRDDVSFVIEREFTQPGMIQIPEGVSAEIDERQRVEALARSIASYAGQAVSAEDIVSRAGEFYQFLTQS